MRNALHRKTNKQTIIINATPGNLKNQIKKVTYAFVYAFEIIEVPRLAVSASLFLYSDFACLIIADVHTFNKYLCG